MVDGEEIKVLQFATRLVTKSETVVLSDNKRKVMLPELDGNVAVVKMPPGRELLWIPPYFVVVSK